MGLLVAGLIAFFAIHLAPAFPDFRAALVARFGLTGFRVALSIASILGLWLLVAGYGAARLSPDNAQLWRAPDFARPLAYAAMAPAFVLLASSLVPSRMRTFTRHPILIAVEIWALVHLFANGTLAGSLLFGSFLIWAVFDHVSLERRGAGNLFGAKPGGARGDALALALGLGLWALGLLGLHRLLIGMPLIY